MLLIGQVKPDEQCVMFHIFASSNPYQCSVNKLSILIALTRVPSCLSLISKIKFCVVRQPVSAQITIIDAFHSLEAN